MPRKVTYSTLNASTIDIMNVIRQNASLQYQNTVPVVETAVDIPRVGEKIYGTPADQTDSAYIYKQGESQLNIMFMGDEVVSIVYVSISE